MNNIPLPMDYYWRNITIEDWTIYDDAFIAFTMNHYAYYVGRAPYLNTGLIVSEIDPSRPGITIGFHSDVNDLKQFIEILCVSRQDSYKWVPATYKNLNSIPKKIVAGFEIPEDSNEPGVLYVGRGKIEGVERMIVGKVVGFNTDTRGMRDTTYSNALFVCYNGKEYHVDEYEVLTYV